MSAIGLVNVQLPAGSHTAELKYTTFADRSDRANRELSCLGCMGRSAILLAIQGWKKTPESFR